MLLVMGGLFFAGLLILSAFSGNSQSWKGQVEDIASGVAGKKVHIGKMTNASLFPSLMFDGEFIYITSSPLIPRDPEAAVIAPEPEESQTSEEPPPEKSEQRTASPPISPIPEDVIISKLQVSIPFWTIFWGSPSVSFFHMEGLVFMAARDRFLEQVSLDWTTPSAPKLLVKGGYGTAPFEGYFILKRAWGGAQLQNKIPFEMRLSDIPMSGLINLNPGSLDITDIDISLAGKNYQAAFSFPADGDFELQFFEEEQEIFRILPAEDILQEVDMIKPSSLTAPEKREFILILCGLLPERIFSLHLSGDEVQHIKCKTDPVPAQQEGSEEVSPNVSQ